MPSAGAPNGGMVTAMAGAPGGGGEAGAPDPGLVSPTCGAGMYDGGEGGCQTCVEAPATLQIACLDYFTPFIQADAGPLYVSLAPFVTIREPLSVGTVDITFVTPNQTTAFPLVFSINNSAWRIDIDSGPDDPQEVIVEPFTTVGACGDTYESTEQIRFVKIANDSYAVTCPDQT